MKFWQVVSWCETEQLVEVAQTAEALGFEGIILAEHIFYPKHTQSHYYYSENGVSPQTAELEFPDPLISFAAIAAATSRLKMMTGIYVLPLRHPVDAAKNMATLARLSNNRFMLGMGAGWLKEEFDQFGIDFDSRGSRLDEMLEIQQLLWRGESLSYRGQHFEMEDIQIRPFPSATIPVIAGGYSKPALARASRCDGWYGPGNSLEELREILPKLQRLRAEAVNGAEADATQACEDYEIIAPLLRPLNAEIIAEMDALGVTGTVAYPFLYGIGPNSSFEEKKAYMQDFAQQHIAVRAEYNRA